MAGEVSVKIRSRAGATAREAVRGRLAEAARQAGRAVAEALLADSRPFVPVLTGALIDSGRVEVVPVLDEGREVHRVTYGGDDVPYARTQHDDPYRHPSLGFTGRALYLKRPMALNAAYYVELFALEFRRAMGDVT